MLTLCTDGLTRCVEDDTLRVVLEQDISAQQMCEQLLAAALDADGGDNITIIIGRMGIRTWTGLRPEPHPTACGVPFAPRRRRGARRSAPW